MISTWISDAISDCGSLARFNLLWSGALMFLFTLFVVFHHLRQRRRGEKSLVDYVEDNLLYCALLIFFCGFCLFGIEYWRGNNAGNLIVWIPQCVVSALYLFLPGTSINASDIYMNDSVPFMTLYIIVHFSALTISAMMVLKVLGYKFESYIYMKLKRLPRKTYVFWGVNENSLMLAESIPDKNTAAIIFVELPNPELNDGDALGGVFNNDGISKDHIYQLEKIGAYLIKAKCRFNELNAKKSRKVRNDVYSMMGIKSLRKFVREVKDVNFYFLSDSEQENLDNLMSIIKFFGADNIDGLHMSRIYCHARGNSLNNIVDRLSDKICFMDSSKLSILQLQKDFRCHPSSLVDIDTEKGVVKSPFNALIIGFGEVGRDAFKFLYEFSSFIGEDGEQSPRTINVVDARLSEMSPRFLEAAPALKGRKDIVWWDDMSFNSQEFWDMFGNLMESLNYVMITLNDDKKAAEFAVTLYEHAYRYRSSMRNFKIFVWLKETKSTDMLKRAADYYMLNSNREDRGEKVLVPFGRYQALFNSHIFDREVIDAESRKFSAQYYEIYKQLNETLNPVGRAAWTGVAKDFKKFADSQQDISNVRHIFTKYILSGVIGDTGKIDRERLDYLRKISLREGVEYVNAKKDVPEMAEAFTLMENLSLTEHLRWNAKMEILGFMTRPYNPETDYCERDYDIKNHECIVSCHDLNTIPKYHDTKIYDWAVVELSFRYRQQFL